MSSSSHGSSWKGIQGIDGFARKLALVQDTDNMVEKTYHLTPYLGILALEPKIAPVVFTWYLSISKETLMRYTWTLVLCNSLVVIINYKVQPPYGGLLSSSSGGLGPFGPKSDFAGRTNGRTDGRTTGFRELDLLIEELSKSGRLMFLLETQCSPGGQQYQGLKVCFTTTYSN